MIVFNYMPRMISLLLKADYVLSRESIVRRHSAQYVYKGIHMSDLVLQCASKAWRTYFVGVTY